jgi:two-component system sensor kinase FixL
VEKSFPQAATLTGLGRRRVMSIALQSDDATMANAELRAFFDAAVDAIVVIDETGLILAFNQAAERTFGHRADEVLGRGVEVLMPEPDRSNHAGYVRRYLQTGDAKIIGSGREVEAVRADGSIFPISLSVGEALAAGRRRFVAIIRDLSSQRAAEMHARAIESRLAHVDRFNLMGEMAAGIAHEINQPLSAIATYAQAARRVLSRKPTDLAVLADICEKIDTQARRAGQVIQNLRNFIRRDDSKAELLDVNRAIAEVRELVEADAQAAGIPVTLHYARDLPPVSAAAVQLQQVLLNLTRNAVDAMRFTDAKLHGIVIESTCVNGRRVRVSVQDRGPGVPETLGENIFHPFVTTKNTGLGVGLAISRTIMQSLGGTLSYADRPGGGAVFSLELPAAAREE